MSSGGPPSEGSLPPIDPERRAETRLGAIMAPLTVVHFLAIVAVLMRLYARIILTRATGRDDWVMLASLVFALGGYIVFILMATLGGMGHHFDTTTLEEQIMFNQLGFWMAIIATTFSLALLKISIALNLLRLNTSRGYVWPLWGVLGFVVCFNIMAIFTWVFRCTPLKFHWDKSVGGYCYPTEMFITFGIVNTSFNIVTDVFFAIVPMPIIWSLQMKRKVRLYLIGILSLGYAAVALGIVKACFQIGYAAITDRTYYNWIQFWGFLQLNVGIIAACAPSLKPLVSKTLGLSTTNSNLYGSKSHGNAGLVTIGGSGATGLRSKRRDHIELQDIDEDEQPRYGMRGHTETVATFYKAQGPEGDASGSEERILGEQLRGAKNGIIRKTEVIVT